MKGHCKCERHRLYSWHQQSVRCPSVFTAIKRSERCPDILCTSGAHIPHPPARLWKCYCNWDASWTGPSTTQEVCILNGVSMRFGAAWPFSDGLDVKYLPLRVKRKGASAVFLSSMGALLNGGVGERRAAVSRTLSLSNVGQNCDKVSSHFSTLKSKKLFVFVFLYKNRSLCANSVGTE